MPESDEGDAGVNPAPSILSRYASLERAGRPGFPHLFDAGSRLLRNRSPALGAENRCPTRPAPSIAFSGPPVFARESTMTQHDFPKTLPAGALPPDDGAMPVIDFDPVPRLRQRRGGWSEERQRAFIAALSNCGSVAAAARSVGMTPRSAYRLCDADGADSFVRAWDEAIDMGVSRLRADALNRALEGGYVPVYRRGKLVRVEHRRNDRLAIALLGGQQRSAADLRRAAVLRREHRLDLFALDAARAEHQRQIEEAETAFRAEVDRLIATVVARGNYGPRITRL